MKKLAIRIGSAAATIALCSGALLAGAGAANAASGMQLIGTDPVATGCSKGAYPLLSRNMVNGTHSNQIQGRMELIYSPACGTNWLNVYGYTPGNNYRVGIASRDNYVTGWYRTEASGVTSARTAQVYAPGNTCVLTFWDIIDQGSYLSEGSDNATFC